MTVCDQCAKPMEGAMNAWSVRPRGIETRPAGLTERAPTDLCSTACLVNWCAATAAYEGKPPRPSKALTKGGRS